MEKVSFCLRLLLLLVSCCNLVNTQNNNQLNNNTKSTIRDQQTFDTKLNHLVVDKNTGRIYIGAVNRIYQLTSDLEITVTEVTGPKMDSPECSHLDCPSFITRKLTNSTNKVLLIDYSTSRLIVCDTLFQGLCSVRKTQNISLIDQEVHEGIVANIDTSSTVAFIAPGPPAPPHTNVMYIGVTHTNNSPYRSEIPAVSSRSLEKYNMLQIASSHVTIGTRMFINNYARESYPVKYVYGFPSEGFSYFLTFQMKNYSHNYNNYHHHNDNHHSQPNEWISKLVRVCQEDSSYFSYTEIPIECIGEDGTKYNSIQAGYLGRPGQDLAESLNIKTSDDVLYAVFSEANADIPTNRTALCVYSLKSIRRKFLQNIKACFNGDGSRGLNFISPSMKCIATRLQSFSEDFCGLDINSPLGGEMPVTMTAAATFDTEVTSVAATSTNNFTVVFIGTSKGRVKKLIVESGTVASEYAEVVIDEGSPINQDMFFDKKETNIYVMSENKVSKVRVHECNVHKTCEECFSARVPYCGWCSMDNKCNLKTQCPNDDNDRFYWINYKNGKC